MKRYLQWLEEHIIYVLVGIALIGLILSTVLASPDLNPGKEGVGGISPDLS